MDERSSASDHKLTGVWDGVYSYPSGGPTVPFVATLIEAGHSLSGTTHEQCLVGGSPNETLYATLMGSREASAVSFVKTLRRTATATIAASSMRAPSMAMRRK